MIRGEEADQPSDESDLFERRPEVAGGALVFKGTLVPVEVLFAGLIAGQPLAAIIETHPAIGLGRAQATIRLAGRKLVERYHAK